MWGLLCDPIMNTSRPEKNGFLTEQIWSASSLVVDINAQPWVDTLISTNHTWSIGEIWQTALHRCMRPYVPEFWGMFLSDVFGIFIVEDKLLLTRNLIWILWTLHFEKTWIVLRCHTGHQRALMVTWIKLATSYSDLPHIKPLTGYGQIWIPGLLKRELLWLPSTWCTP